MKIKKKDIKGIYGLKVEVNESVPVDTVFITPNPAITEDIQKLFQLETGEAPVLTIGYLTRLTDWIKAKHPEYMDYFAALKNCSFEEMGKSVSQKQQNTK